MPSCVEILQVEEQFDRRTRHGPPILPRAIRRSTPSSGARGRPSVRHGIRSKRLARALLSRARGILSPRGGTGWPPAGPWRPVIGPVLAIFFPKKPSRAHAFSEQNYPFISAPSRPVHGRPKPPARNLEFTGWRRILRRLKDTETRGPRGGAQAPGHVPRRHERAGPAPLRLRARRQLRRRGAR